MPKRREEQFNPQRNMHEEDEEVVPDDGDPDYIDESESKPKPKSNFEIRNSRF